MKPFDEEISELGVDVNRPFRGLLRIAEDPTHPQRAFAVFLIALRGYTGALPVLKRLLYQALEEDYHTNKGLIQECIDAFGKFDLAQSHAILQDIFRNWREQDARRSAVEASGLEVKFSEPEILIDAFREDDWHMQMAALYGIEAQAERGRISLYETTINEALSNKAPYIRKQALIALGASKDPKYLDLIRRFFGDEERSATGPVSIEAKEAYEQITGIAILSDKERPLR